MRLSDLLDRDVRTHEGDDLGRVQDVRFERVGGEWHLSALIVGTAAFAERLGFAYGIVERPARLARAMRWVARHARVVPWDAVEPRDGRLVVKARRDDLARPGADDDD
jgi:sporulation protein YlmC with PRC-barrel domain